MVGRWSGARKVGVSRPGALVGHARRADDSGVTDRLGVKVVERDRVGDSTGADLTSALVSGAWALESRVRIDIGLIPP